MALGIAPRLVRSRAGKLCRGGRRSGTAGRRTARGARSGTRAADRGAGRGERTAAARHAAAVCTGGSRGAACTGCSTCTSRSACTGCSTCTSRSACTGCAACAGGPHSPSFCLTSPAVARTRRRRRDGRNRDQRNCRRACSMDRAACVGRARRNEDVVGNGTSLYLPRNSTRKRSARARARSVSATAHCSLRPRRMALRSLRLISATCCTRRPTAST